MNMSDFLENKLIDYIFRNVSYTPPGPMYIALWTATLDDTSTGATSGEVSGGSYARVSSTKSVGNWAATDAPGSTANPSAGTSGTTSNNNAITFPTATASWGTVTYVAILDSATLGAGNILWWGALTTPKTVGSGDVISFAPGNLQVQIDN